MEFFISIKQIANGYLLEYPTGHWVDRETPFFTVKEAKTQQWYCATRSKVEEVMPKIAAEWFDRFQKAKQEMLSKQDKGGEPA